MVDFAVKRMEVGGHVAALKPYQPGKPIEEVKRELGIEGEIVKLASNENPLGPSPKAMEAVASALSNLHLYPDGACHDLRHAVATKLGVTPDSLVFGNGSDEIIHLLGLTFLQPGDEVVTGEPTFVLYEAAATLAGATRIGVPLTPGDLRHDAKAMVAKFSERTRLVFVANPHNPTGSVISREDVDLLLKHLPERAWLILDEAYVDYVEGDTDFPFALDYIRAGAPVIGLRTFSKLYGLAGLRVGYGVAAPDVIRLLSQPRSPFNVNLPAQAAALGAVGDDEFAQRSRVANADGLAQLAQGFDRLGLKWVPSRANFIMVDTNRPCRAVFQRLLERGFIVRTGDIFGLPTMLRVSVGTPHQNQRFLETLADVLPEIPA
jgi:histidinol-phosphate aminotransferase